MSPPQATTLEMLMTDSVEVYLSPDRRPVTAAALGLRLVWAAASPRHFH